MDEHPLRAWRRVHDVTLQKLAADLGVGQPTLSDIENWRRTPSFALAIRLEEVTGIPPRDFVRRPPSP
jgi:transcriptional regulator with XRE-family HTH domain